MLDQRTMPLPLDQCPSDELNQPLGLRRVPARCLQGRQQLLLAAQPFPATCDIGLRFSQQASFAFDLRCSACLAWSSHD